MNKEGSVWVSYLILASSSNNVLHINLLRGERVKVREHKEIAEARRGCKKREEMNGEK